jgi:hypothetical protein
VLPKVVSSVPVAELESSSAQQQDLYQFLGLAPFESDRDVISSRVRDLMREARKYQLGPYAERTQAYLESLASATACLLDPGRKAGYDEALRRRYGLPEIAVPSNYRHGDAIPVNPIHTASRAARGRRGRRKLLPSLVLGSLVLAGAAAHWMIPTTIPVRVASSAPAQNAIRETAPPRQAVVAVTPPLAANQPVRTAPALRDLDATGHVEIEPPPAEPSHETARAESLPSPPADVSAADPPPEFEPPPTDSGKSPSAEEPTRISRTARRDAARTPSPSHAPRSAHPPKRPAAGSQKRAVGHPNDHLAMTSTDVLRELHAFRFNRNRAQHLSSKPHALSTRQIEQLVRYARSAFAGDRSFQRRLDHEVTALRRLDPKLKQLLPDVHR